MSQSPSSAKRLTRLSARFPIADFKCRLGKHAPTKAEWVSCSRFSRGDIREAHARPAGGAGTDEQSGERESEGRSFYPVHLRSPPRAGSATLATLD